MTTSAFSTRAVQQGSRAPQLSVFSSTKVPMPPWQLTVGFKIANGAKVVIPYLGDPGTHTYQRMGNIVVADTVDPSTYPDADIIDGDTWVDESGPTPIRKFWSAAANGGAGGWIRGPVTFTQAADPTTNYPGNVLAGDVWVNTTVSATPSVEIRVGSAWNTIA